MKRIIALTVAFMAITVTALAYTTPQTTLYNQTNDMRVSGGLGVLDRSQCLTDVAQTHAQYQFNQHVTIPIQNIQSKINAACGTPLGTFGVSQATWYLDYTPLHTTWSDCEDALQGYYTDALLYHPADSMGTGAFDNGSDTKKSCVVIIKNNF